MGLLVGKARLNLPQDRGLQRLQGFPGPLQSQEHIQTLPLPSCPACSQPSAASVSLLGLAPLCS